MRWLWQAERVGRPCKSRDQLRRDPTVTDALAIGMGPSFVKTNDWIFARGLKCVAGGLTDNDASDHKLAWAELAEPETGKSR